MKTLILSINILLVCLLLSCTNKEEDPIAERENTIGSGFGKAQSCPYFSSDINGNTVISWVE